MSFGVLLRDATYFLHQCVSSLVNLRITKQSSGGEAYTENGYCSLRRLSLYLLCLLEFTENVRRYGVRVVTVADRHRSGTAIGKHS